MRTRLKDVAAKLNLSPALVSGVLNNRPHIWASEDTRARILEAARALNYHPSAAAQALSKGKTDTVAFVYRRLPGSAYRLAYSGLVDALSAELQSAGYDLVVTNFATQEEVLEHLKKLSNSKGCDAVVLWGREEDTEEQGRLLESQHIPFLVKGRHEIAHPSWHQIDFDHERMMESSVEHLTSLGHQRFAYLGFPHDEGFVHALRRGYIGAHAALLGRKPDPEFFGEFEDEIEPNETRISHWLSKPPSERPTAFVIGAGNRAWQALESSLARIGTYLTDSPGGFAASGITSSPFSLMFGQAHVFQGIEIDNLARYATPGLIHALDTENEHQFIQRFRPKLEPAASLEMLSHGVILAGDREADR
jgi:LacI family transcriptional regulator